MTRTRILALLAEPRTSAELGRALGVTRRSANDLLAYLMAKGDVFRTDGGVWRYQAVDRAARVERMRGWTPAALAEMRRAA